MVESKNLDCASGRKGVREIHEFGVSYGIRISSDRWRVSGRMKESDKK